MEIPDIGGMTDEPATDNDFDQHGESMRLLHHPQMRRYMRPRPLTVAALVCPSCKLVTPVAGLRLQADGSLLCGKCHPADAPRLHWCNGCKRALPASEFKVSVGIFGRGRARNRCNECQQPRQAREVVERCLLCGADLDAVRQATGGRYCSNACKQKAYRQRKASAAP